MRKRKTAGIGCQNRGFSSAGFPLFIATSLLLLPFLLFSLCYVLIARDFLLVPYLRRERKEGKIRRKGNDQEQSNECNINDDREKKT